MQWIAKMSSCFALLVLVQACEDSGGEHSAAAGRACPSATSVGDLAADCASYCAVYNDCVGCGDAAETKCNELCLSQMQSTACFACAVNHIASIVDRLSCDTFAADAGYFTATWSVNACGQTCSP
jgi:hypothetical protein